MQGAGRTMSKGAHIAAARPSAWNPSVYLSPARSIERSENSTSPSAETSATVPESVPAMPPFSSILASTTASSDGTTFPDQSVTWTCGWGERGCPPGAPPGFFFIRRQHFRPSETEKASEVAERVWLSPASVNTSVYLRQDSGFRVWGVECRV